MPGKMPERKPFGRPEPPQNYPKDPDQYADPQNYMYPLDKPIRAKLARKYFDEPRNRYKYTEEERLFIDSRIDEALKRFRITTDEARPPSSPRTYRRKSPKRASRNELDKLGLDELLLRFLGAARLERAKSIPDSLVSLSSLDRDAIVGNVKEYTVQINLKNKVITHDCDDWKNHMRSKLMCKHLGKAFLMVGKSKAAAILKQMLSELDDWTFSAP
jgi:hypothetical protein